MEHGGRAYDLGNNTTPRGEETTRKKMKERKKEKEKRKEKENSYPPDIRVRRKSQRQAGFNHELRSPTEARFPTHVADFCFVDRDEGKKSAKVKCSKQTWLLCLSFLQSVGFVVDPHDDTLHGLQHTISRQLLWIRHLDKVKVVPTGTIG